MDTEHILRRIAGVTGKLDGLSGTTRYEIPEALRKEIRDAADLLRELWEPVPDPH